MKSIALFLVLLMIWGVGLLAFSSRIQQSTPPHEPQVADGIVVLTGRSSRRIEAGMSLLEVGKARRMLISGVDPDATRADIRRVSKAAERIYDCCVDLGFEAANTVGNAEETQGWVEGNGFKTLIVVTADYHMPRSLLEIRSALPDVKIAPYPVVTDEVDARGWWRTGPQARRMIVEYAKYTTILAREAVLRLGPKERPPATSAAPQTKAPAAKDEGS